MTFPLSPRTTLVIWMVATTLLSPRTLYKVEQFCSKFFTSSPLFHRGPKTCPSLSLQRGSVSFPRCFYSAGLRHDMCLGVYCLQGTSTSCPGRRRTHPGPTAARWQRLWPCRAGGGQGGAGAVSVHVCGCDIHTHTHTHTHAAVEV